MGMAAQDAAEQVARLDALQVLDRSMQTLGEAIRQKPLTGTRGPGAPGLGRADGGVRGVRRARPAAADCREPSSARRRPWCASGRRPTSRWRACGRCGWAPPRWPWRALRPPSISGAACGARCSPGPKGRRRCSRGSCSTASTLQGRDEFADVAHSMNTMAAALESTSQREQQQRQLLEADGARAHGRPAPGQRVAARTDTRRRQLLADISHELRTPTTAIRGEAEITLRGARPRAAEYRAALQRIVETSRQLACGDRRPAGHGAHRHRRAGLVRRPVDLKPSRCRGAGPGRAAGCRARGAALAPRAEERLPPRAGAGDAQRLAQLLLLLLDNAIGYSHRGGLVQLRVAAAAQGVAAAGGEADRASASSRRSCRRSSSGTSAARRRAATGPSGIGLGLAIARALAQAHGGTLELHSQFAGPDAACARLCAAAVAGRPAVSRLGRRRWPRAAGMNILLVEDDARIADFLSRGLRAEGSGAAGGQRP
jgi:two-component system, OmpR family, sensor kinase